MISEGISTGLKVGLFFLLGFVLLGEPIGFSLFLAILGGLAGGWIAAGLKSTETLSPPQQPTTPEPVREKSLIKEAMSRLSTRQRFQHHHKKRPPRVPKPSIFFWKNARSSRLKSRR